MKPSTVKLFAANGTPITVYVEVLFKIYLRPRLYVWNNKSQPYKLLWVVGVVVVVANIETMFGGKREN